MHELAITESIAKIILDVIEQNHATGASAVWLKAGQLRNLEETWVQRYLDGFVKGTRAEGIVAHVERVPVTVACTRCGYVYPFKLHSHEHGEHEHPHGGVSCPKCSNEGFDLVTGNELSIASIQLEGVEGAGAGEAAQG